MIPRFTYPTHLPLSGLCGLAWKKTTALFEQAH